MKIYWSLASVPELALLPKAERNHIWRLAYRQSFRNIVTWLALALCGICAGLGSLIGDRLGYGLLGSMIGGGMGGFIFGQISIYTALPFIRTAVRQRNGV